MTNDIGAIINLVEYLNRCTDSQQTHWRLDIADKWQRGEITDEQAINLITVEGGILSREDAILYIGINPDIDTKD